MGGELTLGLAFIAGLVSFISPCVLPLVPAYVGYMGGRMTSTVSAAVKSGETERNRFETLTHGVFFVLGFTFVFVTVGVILTGVSQVFDLQEVLVRLGGIIIILFGLQIMGYLPRFMTWVIGNGETMNSGTGKVIAIIALVLVGVVLAWGFNMPYLSEFNDPPPGLTSDRILSQALVPVVIAGLYFAWLAWTGAFVKTGDFVAGVFTRIQGWLYMDTRQQMTARGDKGYLGSAFMGMVFSAGWTPCIGPVYGAILTLAASGDSIGTAAGLLVAYSLGLGVPFLLTALALDQAQGILRRLQRHMRTIELISGLFLVLIGVLVLSGQLQQLSQFGPDGILAYNLELCVEFFTRSGELVTTLLSIALLAALTIAGVWLANRQRKASGGGFNFTWLGALVLAGGSVLLTAATFPTHEFNTCLAEGLDYPPLLEEQVENVDGGVDDGTPNISVADSDTLDFGSENDNAPNPDTVSPGDVAGDAQQNEGGVLDNVPGLDTIGGAGEDEETIAVDLPQIGLGEGLLAPNFETTTVMGEEVTLEDFRGQVVVVNFWATWCTPCRLEMPHFQEAFNELRDEGFTILAVNRGETAGQVENFRDERGLTFPLLMDQDELITTSIYQVIHMPTSYVLDANGVIVAQHFGQMTADELAGYLDAAFAASE